MKAVHLLLVLRMEVRMKFNFVLKVDKDKWKNIFRKCFFRNGFITLFLVVLSTALLLYAFLVKDANPVIAYSGYAISAYSLVVAVIRVPPIVKKVRKILYANRYASIYLSDAELRARISLYTGFAINVLYAIFKFTMGVIFGSIWIGAVAVYYIILSVMRFSLLRREREFLKYEDIKEQKMHGFKSYRLTGKLMFLLNIAVSGMVAQMIFQNKSYEYPGFLIYASAAYAFYCLTRAVINMVKYRKMDRPVLSAAKMLSFSCALISILAMQTAMITQFGEGNQNFQRIMNTLTGTAVCAGVFAMAVLMVKKANKEIVKMEMSDGEYLSL